MKFLLALLSSCFVLAQNQAYSQTNNSEIKRYSIESAFIKYNIYGNTKGEEILKFDNWGNKEIDKIEAVREIVFYSVKNIQKIKTMNIFNNNILYAIDLKSKSGVKTYSENYINDNQFTKEEIVKNGGKLVSNEIILGKECEVWKTNKLKIWLWKGMALKIVSKIIGKDYTKEAVGIKENISLKANELTIPIDVRIIDYSNQGKAID